MDVYALLFCLVDEFSEEDVQALHDLINEIAFEREWVLESPSFLDELDDSSCSRPEDDPIRTVGGVLRLHRSDAKMEHWQQMEHLADVEFVVGRFAQYSLERKCELEIELGGELIGDIRCGEVSTSITEGLIDEWRKQVSQT